LRVRSSNNTVGVSAAPGGLLVGGDGLALGHDAVGVAGASAVLLVGGGIDDDGGGGDEGVHLCEWVCGGKLRCATGEYVVHFDALL
jgi:hypothetical protein